MPCLTIDATGFNPAPLVHCLDKVSGSFLNIICSELGDERVFDCVPNTLWPIGRNS